MGSLSNLYISQSYQSLIHLGTNNTASATIIELQDGLGNNLGVGVNTQGDISASGEIETNNLRIELDTEITGGVDINTYVTSSTIAYENLTDPYYTDVVRVIGNFTSSWDEPTINDVQVGWICNGINVVNGVVTAVSGSGTGDVWVTIGGEFPQINQHYTFTGAFGKPVRITGSLEVSNDITASNILLSGDMYVSGTIHAYEVITLIESSSVIFSSGSNVIGDEVTDTQTIVGQTSISGSLTVEGPFHHSGSIDIIGDVEITGSLKVSNEISSSTIAGLGNASQYSASVATTIYNLSQSVDSRLDYLEGPFSTSVDQRLDSLEFFSSSQEAKDITLAAYTGSVNTKFNAIGVYTQSMNLYTQSNDLTIQGIQNYTSSLRTAFTASGTDVAFNGNIIVSGSITAHEIHTIIESSSVIFSSGSNVLGDSVSDTQTLNGTVNIPNTLFVAGVEFIPFSSSVDFRINQKLSTASFDNFVNNTYTPFSSSVDFRLDNLEAWSSSLQTNFVTQAELAAATGALEVSIAKKLDSSSFQTYTASQDAKNSTLATYTGSVDTKFTTIGTYTSSIDTKFTTLASYTGSVNTKFTTIGSYTASNDTKWSTIGGYTSSIDTKFGTLATYTGSNDTKWNTIGLLTGSYATTGSNNFIGTETISGSLLVSGSTRHIGTMINSGSVQGQVITILQSALTASIDCSLGNFFYFNAGSNDNYRLRATNIQPGETITLRINKTALNATITIDSGSIKFPSGLSYVISPDNNVTDILTFVSFDTGSLYGVAAKNFV